LSDSDTDITTREHVPVNAVSEIELSKIEANPFQPRENFDEEQLDELVQSIQVHGIIQPITVRKVGNDRYQIISGERRTRAAIKAGITAIPAFVRVANDQNMLEMALIENTHRENLNAVEIALSYKRLVEECGLKQEELAERVGKSRSSVTNYRRLLKLPEEIQIAICEDQISMGHARALINVEQDQIKMSIFKDILNKGISVRKTEELVKKAKDHKENGSSGTKNDISHEITESLQKLLNKKVKVRTKSSGKTELIIPFDSQNDLDAFIERIERL